MATYNGEKNIRRQMDTILNQTYPHLQVFVRDDGSTDRTVEIVREYERKTGKVHLLEDNKGNLKPPETFYQMMRICPRADYYAFADQDDEWLPEKVARGVFYMLKKDQAEPIVYMSSYDYHTEDGKYIRKFPDQRQALKLNTCLFNSPASAFTVMFNEPAREKFLPDHEGVGEMHDRRFVRSGIAMGQICYDPKVTAHHIRYETSMTEGDSTILNLVLTSVKNEIFGSDFLRQRKELGDYLRQYSGKLSEKDRKVLALFSSRNTPVKWMKKLFFPHRLRTRWVGEMSMRLAILLGRV